MFDLNDIMVTLNNSDCWVGVIFNNTNNKQESPALADPRDAKACKKIAPIQRAYNVVADNTGLSSFV